MFCCGCHGAAASPPPAVHHANLRAAPCPVAANERTFLAWLGMATTLGTISTAIAGFAVADGEGKHQGGISPGTVELITVTLLPVSILMIAYALFTFYWRSEFIRRKQVGFFDDKVRREVQARVGPQPQTGVPGAQQACWVCTVVLASPPPLQGKQGEQSGTGSGRPGARGAGPPVAFDPPTPHPTPLTCRWAPSSWR